MMGKSEYESSLLAVRKVEWADLQRDWEEASQRPMKPSQIQALASRWAKFYQNMDRITDSGDLAETLAEATVEAANDLWDRENNDAPVEFLIGRVIALVSACAEEHGVNAYEAARSFLAQCINQKMPSPLDEQWVEASAERLASFPSPPVQIADIVEGMEVSDVTGDVDNEAD